MTIVTDTPATLAEWSEIARGAFAEHARPLHDKTDSRLAELLASDKFLTRANDDDLEAGWLGEWYFVSIASKSLPPVPIDQPQWATRRSVEIGDYPVVTVVDSRPIDSMIAVALERRVEFSVDEPGMPAKVGEPSVFINVNGDLTLREAAAVHQALRELLESVE